MASKTFFDGKRVFEPGAHSRILSGISNPPLALPYGNLLLIDTGSGAGFGGGSGVSGTHKQGIASLQSFNTLKEAQAALGGGISWKAAEELFIPSGPGINGVSKLYYLRAATTTPASIVIDTEETGNGGQLTIQTRDEGAGANGVLDGGEIKTGYGVKVIFNATTSPKKAKIIFYRGTYKGQDENNVDYFDKKEDSHPQIVFESPWFDDISLLKASLDQNPNFNLYFKTSTLVVAGTGINQNWDAAGLTDQVGFTGGTETYSGADFLKAMEVLEEISDLSFVLYDQYDLAAPDTNLTTLKNQLAENPFKFFTMVGCGSDGTLDDSIALAKSLDSAYFMVSHGGKEEFTPSGVSIFRNSYLKAAQVVGRLAGLAPQTPLTFKTIPLDAEVNPLTASQRETLLDSGVIHTKRDNELGVIVNQGINTTQRNAQMINSDGTSYEISIMRIAEQLNKEIVVNAKLEFFSQEDGVNRASVSPQDVQSFVKKFLKARTATDTENNLILGYESVTVDVQGSNYFINYGFYPNTPVNNLFFTGTMLTPNN